MLWTRSSVDTSPNKWNALLAAIQHYTGIIGTPVEMVTVPDAEFRTELSQAPPGGDGPDVLGLVAQFVFGLIGVYNEYILTSLLIFDPNL